MIFSEDRTSTQASGNTSRNMPLGDTGLLAELPPDRTTPLFLYCLSGARSAQATAQLRRMGYENVTNIGGISGYRGKVER